MDQRYGMVQVATPAQRIEADRSPLEASREAFESGLTAHIRSAWQRNRRAKEGVHQRMLKCMRQRVGEYEPEVLQAIRAQGGSEIYMMLTSTKCRAAQAWIADIELPTGERSWMLEPTPVPELPPEVMAEVEQAATAQFRAAVSQGQVQADPQTWREMIRSTKERVRKAMQREARDRMDRMARRIDDQLTEGRWVEAIEATIDDFVTFQACILKGPIVRRRTKLKWGPGGQPVPTQEAAVEFERMSPYDAYPAPFAESPQDGDFIERMRLKRRTLHSAIGMPGYNDAALRSVLEEFNRGGLREWLWEDYERHKLEGRESVLERTNQDTIDALHYWGSVQGLMLVEWGMPAEMVPDVLAEYEVEAILIGRHVVRVRLNEDPLHRRPYAKACMHPLPGAFWGLALPELMADIASMCNATARALANNMGISSGPQVEVYMDRLADGQDVTKMHPWKLWAMKDDPGGGSNNRALNFFQPTSNAAELLAVYEQFERRADDATQIPRYTHGNERVGGAGATASGLQLLMNSAAKGIKKAVMQFDTGVVVPTIEQLFTLNMLYDQDDSIKGDAKVLARGATALLSKEQRQARREHFLAATANPIDAPIIGVEGRAAVLRSLEDGLDLSEQIVPEAAELRERQERQPPPPEAIEQELEKAKLQMEAAEKEKDRQHERGMQDDEQAHELLMERVRVASARAQQMGGQDHQARLEMRKAKREAA